MSWAVKVTEEYAAWFTALIKEDLTLITIMECRRAQRADLRVLCERRRNLRTRPRPAERRNPHPGSAMKAMPGVAAT